MSTGIETQLKDTQAILRVLEEVPLGQSLGKSEAREGRREPQESCHQLPTKALPWDLPQRSSMVFILDSVIFIALKIKSGGCSECFELFF